MTISNMPNNVRFGQLLFNKQPYAEVADEAKQTIAETGLDTADIQEGIQLIQPHVDTLDAKGIDVAITSGKDHLTLTLEMSGKNLLGRYSSSNISASSVNTPLSVVNALERQTDSLKRFVTTLSGELRTTYRGFLNTRSDELKAERQAKLDAETAETAARQKAEEEARAAAKAAAKANTKAARQAFLTKLQFWKKSEPQNAESSKSPNPSENASSENASGSTSGT